MSRYLIIGCGWVGSFFAEKLVKNTENRIYATHRNHIVKHQYLKDIGVLPYMIDFDQELEMPANFPEKVDYVLVSIPVSRQHALSEIQYRFTNLCKLLSQIRFKKVIYLSSVGIYPDSTGVFNEDFPTQFLNKQLLEGESFFIHHPESVVLRLGGLFGYDRVFAKYFQNKICTSGDQPSNFIHVDDVLCIMDHIFKEVRKRNLYNIVCPDHPKKEDVISISAEKYGYPLPQEFQHTSDNQKIVDGSRFSEEYAYSYIYPSPLLF